MRRITALLMLAVLTGAVGCTSQQCRPCGPGYLGNIFIPQGFAGVDFRDACHGHDHCYGTDCPRKDCDVQFREDLLCACECSPHPALCRLRAWQWYAQVRLGGGWGYRQSQCERECDGCSCDEAVEPASVPAGADEIEQPTLD